MIKFVVPFKILKTFYDLKFHNTEDPQGLCFLNLHTCSQIHFTVCAHLFLVNNVSEMLALSSPGSASQAHRCTRRATEQVYYVRKADYVMHTSKCIRLQVIHYCKSVLRPQHITLHITISVDYSVICL